MNSSNRLSMVALLMSLAVSASADDPGDAAVALLPEGYRAAVTRALGEAGANRDQLVAAIGRVKAEERIGVAFLIANMPQRDLVSLPADFLVENVALAYQARASSEWARAVPDEIFLNDVLPYANLSEGRANWRKDFAARFGPEVKECKTAGEAAIKLNQRVFEVLNVKYHPTKRPKPDQNPEESIAAGYASCTGLSILLVDACRAVGVPARTVGTPAWTIPKGDANGNHAGNHTWAEVWDGQWHFLGACENSKLSQTWFSGNASKADGGRVENRIYAASFRRTDVPFVMVWDPAARFVSAEDVTAFYTARRAVKVSVAGKDGAVAGRVTVRLGGRIVADVEAGAEVVLAGGKTYQATITRAGAGVVEREFAVGEEKVVVLQGE